MLPLALFLLGVLAVAVGTVQAAFSVLMRLSRRLLAERTGRSARLGRFLDDPLLLFIPARLLLGMIHALAAVLLAVMLPIEGLYSILFLVLAIGGFVLAFEHAAPLLIVRRDPERVLDLTLPAFDIVARLLDPLTIMLINLFFRPPRDRAARADAPEEAGDATQVFLETGQQEGLIQHDERRLLQSIVDFGGTIVREVMTPRPDIVAIREDATLDELRARFREDEYSRIPVYKENLDNIVGLVYVKDLISLTGTPGEERPITTLMRGAYFVPETKKVADLLREFQREQVQSALVVDEYGGTAGLVTVEDLLEEIVGEIRDEYDVESEPVLDEGDGNFVFSGKVDVGEVVERFEVTIERDGFETVGGYLLARLGRVPAVGERFEVDGLIVEVLEGERRRITKVRMRRAAPVDEGTGTFESEQAG